MVVRLAGLAVCAAVAGVASAQGYPNHSVRLVVGFSAGGATDVAARAVAQKLTEGIGQQVIVDNRPGAASNIGAELVARSAPDGYTLFMGSVSLSINTTLYTRLRYDPLRDLVGVVHVATTPFMLVVHPSLPVNSVKDLIAFTKARPGQVNFATAGPGSGAHLFMELFQSLAGVKLSSVHYKGAAPASADVVAGHVPVQFDNIMTLYPLSRAGKLRALAVSTAQRSPVAPEVPTMAQAGVPGYDADAWFGIFVPAGTPKDIIARLNSEVLKGLQMPDMQKRLRSFGATPGTGTPEQFTALFHREIVKWAKVVKRAGVQVN